MQLIYGMINDEVKTDDVNTVDSKAKMNKGHHVHLLEVVIGVSTQQGQQWNPLPAGLLLVLHR